ncbi:MAG: response regulator [Myxococcales bacterium]|nr:response regulator [Myxococcales bacterium]
MAKTIALLLIEDDEDDYTLAMESISEISACDYEVTWVQDFDEGLGRLLAEGFDICLLDYRLGARTGLELLREARARGCETPVVLLTSQPGREIDIEAMKAGASDFLSKFDLDGAQLERTLRYAMERASSLRALHDLNVELRTARNQALKSSLAKSSFLASVSHELRTPLNAIIGYSELILDVLDDARPEEEPAPEVEDARGLLSTLRRDVRRIHDAGAHLLALVSDVLDLNKIESGRLSVVAGAVELEPLVRETLASLGPLVEANANALTLRCPAPLPGVVADATRLRQILVNIVGNACKFTRDGVIDVELRRRPASADERARAKATSAALDIIEINVRDTGIGMTPAQLSRLFDSFSQADESISRRFGGTGLGLAISRRLARMMGGDIRVTSVYGEGSTFTLEIPSDIRGFLRPSATRVADGGPLPRVGPPLVLLFGDNAGFLAELGERLRADSLEAVVETDARAVTASIEHLAPAAIVTALNTGDPMSLATLASVAETGADARSLTTYLLEPSGRYGVVLEASGILSRRRVGERVEAMLERAGVPADAPLQLLSNSEALQRELAAALAARGRAITTERDASEALLFIDLAAPGVFSSYAFAGDAGPRALFLVAPAERDAAARVDVNAELRPLIDHLGLPRARLLGRLGDLVRDGVTGDG